MLSRDLMIPLPQGSTATAFNGETKEAVGLHYCLNCGELAVVKVENKGRLYAYCSPKEITVKGCKSRATAPATARPIQTFDEYEVRLEGLGKKVELGSIYKAYLSDAWLKHKGSKHERPKPEGELP